MPLLDRPFQFSIMPVCDLHHVAYAAGDSCPWNLSWVTDLDALKAGSIQWVEFTTTFP